MDVVIMVVDSCADKEPNGAHDQCAGTGRGTVSSDRGYEFCFVKHAISYRLRTFEF